MGAVPNPLLGPPLKARKKKSDAVPQPGAAPPVPLHRVYPTSSKFYCGGRCLTGHGMTSRDECCYCGEHCSGMNVLTWVLILTPCVIFFVYAAPHYVKDGFYALPACSFLVFLVTIGFLLSML